LFVYIVCNIYRLEGASIFSFRSILEGVGTFILEAVWDTFLLSIRGSVRAVYIVSEAGKLLYGVL
jgi:hypothetical protein